MVEGGGIVEHHIHTRNTACIPVTEILIEAIPRTTVRLHNRTSVPSTPQSRHVRHAARIPHAYVIVPRLRCRCVTTPKHQLCSQCLIRARDALRVERTRTRSREHAIESRGLRNVPAEALVEGGGSPRQGMPSGWETVATADEGTVPMRLTYVAGGEAGGEAGGDSTGDV